MNDYGQFAAHQQGPGVVPLVIGALFAVFMIASLWKVFTKAGEPGWAAIVPFYNLFVLLKIAGKPAWWLVLFLIPLVSMVMAFITYISLAKAFGKSAGFGVGLVLLGPIFLPILAFGSAEYIGAPGGTALRRAA
jgi:hypothetical protein